MAAKLSNVKRKKENTISTYGVIMGLEMLSLESQFPIEYPSSRKKEHGCHGFDGYARI